MTKPKTKKPKKTVPPKKTERGFGIYDEFTDSYGSTVKVQESSSAEGPHVWIFCQNEKYGRPDPTGVDRSKDFTPHLSYEQAKRVRDALNDFLLHARETWDPSALKERS